MPPNRSYKRKRRSRYKSNKGLSKLKKDVKWIKKGIEFKLEDSDHTIFACDAAGVIKSMGMETIAQDASLDGRVGEKISARRVMIRGFWSNNRGTPSDVICRIVLFRQIRPNEAQPTFGELFTSSNINIFRNIANKTDFKVYLDHTFTMDTGQHTLIPFKIVQKLNHTCRYKAAATAQPVENGMYMAFISTQVTTANAPGVTMKVRYSYTDQ